ncbi:MAG: integrase [Desulfurococcaceae archaeon]
MDLLYEFLRGDILPKEVDDVIALSPKRLESFADYLRSLGRSERTVEERLRYLRRLCEELGWSFSVDDLYKYLSDRSPNVRDHIVKALRLYLRFEDREDVLSKLRGGWIHKEVDLEDSISLEEALDAIKVATSVSRDYSLYLATLLVTGLRPHEVRSLRWSSEVIPQVIKVEKVSRTKRAYYAFLTPNLYLELIKEAKEEGGRVVHYRREIEYLALKEIRTKIPSFRPYSLRALNTTLLVKAGVPQPVIEFIHGWAPRNIMRLHYLDKQLTQKEMLKDILQKHNQALKEVDEKLNALLLTPTM